MNTILSDVIFTFFIPATTERFIARDKFQLNTGGSTGIRISYMSDSFQEWFLDKIEDPFPGSTISCRKLEEHAIDDVILSELGSKEKAITSLTEIFHMMEAWEKDEDNNLTDKEIYHIFYAEDAKNMLRSINVCWLEDGWGINAFSTTLLTEDLEEWEINSSIFYRHS